MPPKKSNVNPLTQAMMARAGVQPAKSASGPTIIGQGAAGSGNSAEDAPKIEFPCKNYPIKVMGQSGSELRALVIDVMDRHAPGFDQNKIKVKDSAKGTFQSLTVKITATGVDQLEALHNELKASPLVKMVL